MTEAAPRRARASPPWSSPTFKIGLIGFGGVNAWARRVIVEEKRWLTEQDYARRSASGRCCRGRTR
jgi:hypothetical protein